MTQKTTVTVAQVPGKTAQVELEGDATVSDVMNAAGLAFSTAKGLKVALNGQPITQEAAAATPVKSGDRVTASKGAKGAK